MKKLVLIICILFSMSLAAGQAVNPETDSITYYSFDNFTTGDSSVNDESPNSFNGVVSGDPQSSTGILNSAVDVDGSDDYFDVASPTDLGIQDLSGEATVSTWVKGEDWKDKPIFNVEAEISYHGEFPENIRDLVFLPFYWIKSPDSDTYDSPKGKREQLNVRMVKRQ